MKEGDNKAPVDARLDVRPRSNKQDRNIGEVGWPPSIVRALSGAYYQTLGDVAMASDYELIVLPRIGPRCLRLIDNQLKANGYQRRRGVSPDTPYEAALGQRPKLERQSPRRPWGVPREQAKSIQMRPCAHCQTPFVGTWKNQKFCSRQCAGEARRKKPMDAPLFCAHCKEAFTPQKNRVEQRFCSTSCARRSASAPPERLARILYLRYEQGLTLRQIGDAMELTRERVRQILAAYERSRGMNPLRPYERPSVHPTAVMVMP